MKNQEEIKIELKHHVVIKKVKVNGKEVELPVKVFENKTYEPLTNPVGCKSYAYWQDWYSSVSSHK